MEQEINTKTFRAQRAYPFTPAEIFAAFTDPNRLAKWWGPHGFSNTFEIFEFKNGGIWNFLMHAPNGSTYPNKCIFKDIQNNKKIVIEHVVQPYFTLTVDLEIEGRNTKLIWTQQFDDAKVAEAMRHIVVKANEENLEKLNLNLIGKS